MTDQPQCKYHLAIEQRNDDQDRRLSDHDRQFENIETTLQEIRDGLMYRPTWTVAVIFSIMSSAIVALVILLLKQGV